MALTACACMLNFLYIDKYGNRTVIVLNLSNKNKNTITSSVKK